jgi:hypothetical protein
VVLIWAIEILHKTVDVDDIVKEATRTLKAADTPTALKADDEEFLNGLPVLSINALYSRPGTILKLRKFYSYI